MKKNEIKTYLDDEKKFQLLFFENLSNKICAPLNVILGFTEQLKKEELSAENKNDCIKGISENSKKLLQNIEKMVMAISIEEESIPLNKEMCEVNSLMYKLFQTFSVSKKSIGKGHIELRFKMDAKTNPSLLTDMSKLEQVFINLIENALKYTTSGFVEFGYEFNSSENIWFFVKDTGLGIPNENQKDIFKKFNQFDNGYENNTGIGVGLYVSKYLIQKLGGELYVDSTVNKGSMFYFKLPYINLKTKTNRNKL